MNSSKQICMCAEVQVLLQAKLWQHIFHRDRQIDKLAN